MHYWRLWLSVLWISGSIDQLHCWLAMAMMITQQDNKETIEKIDNIHSKLNKSKQMCLTNVHRQIQLNNKIATSIRQCCHHMHFNDCMEKQCINYNKGAIDKSIIGNCSQIFLTITDPICLPVVRQPKQYCDINVGVFGLTMIHYSNCRLQMVEFLREFYGPPQQWLYGDDGGGGDVIQQQSLYKKQCCLTYTACHCFERQFKQKCQQRLMKQFQKLSDKMADYHCRCPGLEQIDHHQQQQTNGRKSSDRQKQQKNCTKIIEDECQWMIPENRRLLLEYQNFLSYSIFIAIVTIITTILFCTFCSSYGIIDFFLRKLQPKRWRFGNDNLADSQPLFRRPIIGGGFRFQFIPIPLIRYQSPSTRSGASRYNDDSPSSSSSSSYISSTPSSSITAITNSRIIDSKRKTFARTRSIQSSLVSIRRSPMSSSSSSSSYSSSPFSPKIIGNLKHRKTIDGRTTKKTKHHHRHRKRKTFSV
nr:uncharacterized protein LOC124489981 [Dermatophagoides farinae]